MTSLATLFVPLALASAGGPGALETALVAAREEARLPVGFAVEVAPQVSLRFHHRQDWSLAFFVPATGEVPPSLRLYAPYYLRGLRLAPLTDLRVDTAEYLFHALARGYFELEVLGGSRDGVARARAEAAMPEVPAAKRLDAYLDAASSFVAHALSVAVELERKSREWAADGRSLCPDSRRLPIFDLWERIFGDEPYQGAYHSPRAADGQAGASTLRYSRNALQREDKDLWMAALLEGAWSGRAGEDFTHFCLTAGEH